ncbi:MAG: TRAP transporter permease [Hyphomicrobiales bacterium]
MTAGTETKVAGLKGFLGRLAHASGDTRPMRQISSRRLQAIITGIATAFALLYIYFAGFGYFSPESFVSLYIGFTLTLIFLLYGATSQSPTDRPSAMDIVLIVLTILAMLHYTFMYPIRFVERYGLTEWHDIVMGALTIMLVIEGCRRVLSFALPILSVAMLLYLMYGNHLPGLIGHTGFSFEDSIGWLYSNQAIFGSITRIFASFVFLFIIFGTLLERTGGRALFIDLPLVFIGRMRGGPAKVAVVASALFGMISGASVANVVSTGSFTIPLMKRAGFPPHVAGGFEATASVVGVTMPPLMGAAIFIMAEFTRIPYMEIMKVSILPSILFLVSLFFIAGAYAKKHQIGVIPKEEIGSPGPILKEYWPFFVPVAILVTMLISGYSPDLAVFAALPAIIVANLLSPNSRLSFREWINVLATAGLRSLTIGGLAGCLGILIGVVVKTALATKLSYIVVDLSGGYLLAAIAFTALVTLILGMGVSSVTADYLLLSILVAPALIQLGASVMAAHLMIIWYSQTSNLTPPVCAGAFAAAGIAQANPWKTAFFAVRIGLFLYILPLSFVYGHILDVDQTFLWIQSIITIGLSALCFSGVVIGYLMGNLSWLQRGLLAAAMLSLYEPSVAGDIVGAALLATILLWQWLRKQRQPASMASPAKAEK